MVRAEKLTLLLTEFARTLITDFPIQAILDHLVERIVDTLDVTGAGVTLISPGSSPHYIAASDSNALVFERMQATLGQGPCRIAYQTGSPVMVPDLALERRFPRFTMAASVAGLAASFTFPLRHNDGCLGALDLYRDTVGPLDASDMAAAQTLADVTAAYILNAQAREDAQLTSNRFRDESFRDPLTGLANRVLLHQRLEHAAHRAERTHSNAAVLFADLDHFKRINDTYGHQVGDELLVEVARRLSGLVRPGDTLARVSGDEFVFLCEDLARVQDVQVLATRIDNAFIPPFRAAGTEVNITASVGMAFAGPGQIVSDQLVVEADGAMYKAKREGGGRHQIIDLRETHRNAGQHGLEHDLRIAFGERRLEVQYQPILRTDDRWLTGVEALLRWTHPRHHTVPASDVIDIAERNGLILEIGAWVLTQACIDHENWQSRHPAAKLDLAVNLSVRQLLDPDFIATLEDIIVSTGIDPTTLVLEITEGTLIGDAPLALTALAKAKALGVRISLDDFGVGYSSLNYLRQYPFDILKIDKMFIHSIVDDPAGAAIVSAVTDLAHVLGLTVIAEGVETLQQHEHITRMGCDAAQGFFYAAPMSAQDIEGSLGAFTAIASS